MRKKTKTKEELFSLLNISMRKLKLKTITENLELDFDKSNIQEIHYKAALEFSNKFGGVLTGSTVLRGYDIIKRHPKDVDMIITKNALKELKKTFMIHQTEYVDEMDVESIGYIYLNNVPIDLFVQEGKHLAATLNEDGILIDNPFSILNKKMEFYDHEHNSRSDRAKDAEDFEHIIETVL